MNHTLPSCLRIALVTETFAPEVNGVAMTLGRLVDGLLARGHSVQLVRPCQSAADQPVKRSGLEEILVPGMSLPGYSELRWGWPAGDLLSHRWGNERPDTVHVATEGPLGWSAVAAARALHLPVTSSFHTNFHNYARHYGIGLLHRPIAAYLRHLHNRTQTTLVPTQGMVQTLHNQGYHHVGLMARGVDTALFHPTRRCATLRASWGAQEGDLVVACVGRLAKEKSVGTVLKAFTAIQAQLPRTKLLLVGDGPLRPALQANCPQAIFAGMQKGEALAAHYASADLFVFPSLSETYGNVVPEALASGLAVVAYAHAAAADLINDGDNGLLVSPGDESLLIRTAVALANAPGRQQRLRHQAAPSVAHLSWAAVTDGFVASLQAVVQQHSAALAAANPPPRGPHTSLSLPNA